MSLRHSMAMGTAAALAAPAFACAAEATLKVELPRLTVAEYHRPYLAVWLEKAADPGFAANLVVWYDRDKRDNGGAKWLKDMRSWWRKSGHDAPAVDGITGATRTTGEHAINLDRKSVV